MDTLTVCHKKKKAMVIVVLSSVSIHGCISRLNTQRARQGRLNLKVLENTACFYLKLENTTSVRFHSLK